MTLHQISRRAVLTGLLLAAALPASADVLDDLRVAGAVGERFDGLLVVRDAKAKGAKAKVEEINAKRLKIYAKHAGQDGATVAHVGAIYAEEIMENAPKGTWFLQANGNWTRK